MGLIPRIEEKVKENRIRGEIVIAPKKVRIAYTDPDATDSDSNDDSSPRIKRVIREITFPTKSEEIKPEIDESKRLKRSSSMFKGVRKRKWGKFAAEIRDPFTKARLWLGSYDDEVTAAKVYQEKKLEFERLLMIEKNKNLSTKIDKSCSEESNVLSSSLPSPSSVLQIKNQTAIEKSNVVKEDVSIRPEEEEEKEQSFLEYVAAELMLAWKDSDNFPRCGDSDLIYVDDFRTECLFELLPVNHPTIDDEVQNVGNGLCDDLKVVEGQSIAPLLNQGLNSGNSSPSIERQFEMLGFVEDLTIQVVNDISSTDIGIESGFDEESSILLELPEFDEELKFSDDDFLNEDAIGRDLPEFKQEDIELLNLMIGTF